MILLVIQLIYRRARDAVMGGAPLELKVIDSGESVEKAANAAQRMVADYPDLAGATRSYLSSFTPAVTEVTERADLPMLTLSYSDLITERGFNNIFPTSATSGAQAEIALPIIMDLAETQSGTRPKPDTRNIT
jgi:branched-chain amino acid transport system substrate-binding protein